MPTVFEFSLENAEIIENYPLKTMSFCWKMAYCFAIRGMCWSIAQIARRLTCSRSSWPLIRCGCFAKCWEIFRPPPPGEIFRMQPEWMAEMDGWVGAQVKAVLISERNQENEMISVRFSIDFLIFSLVFHWFSHSFIGFSLVLSFFHWFFIDFPLKSEEL